MNTDSGEVTITNTEGDPWDTDVLLFLPDGASPVNPESSLMQIYTAMVIGDRAQERDFSNKAALEAATRDLQTAITYVLGRIEATAGHLDQETKHRLTMAQLRGMPVEMLDRAYNRYRLEHHGINLDDHPQYRTTRPSTNWASRRRPTKRWPTSSSRPSLHQWPKTNGA